jgi:phenylacetate-CoA ligase
VDPSEIVRIYSTSGTTGTPSYIPLTAADLDNWVTGSARSYAASGVTAGELMVSTYNAGPFVAGAALGAFDRIGLRHIPVGTGNTERLIRAVELLRPTAAVLTPSNAAHVIEWAADRGFDLAASSVRRVTGGRRAGWRRAGLPGPARARLGRAGDRGDGGRRPRRVAVGRVRAAGRDAPGRPRVRPPELIDPETSAALELEDGASGELVLTTSATRRPRCCAFARATTCG